VRHHGRLFVVGQTAKIEGEEWISGVEGGVAWDSVITYVLFPSLSELNNRIKRHDETQTGCLPDLAMKSLAERIPGKTKASAADRKKGMA